MNATVTYFEEPESWKRLKQQAMEEGERAAEALRAMPPEGFDRMVRAMLESVRNAMSSPSGRVAS